MQGDLTTLENVKAYLGILKTVDGDDVLIERMISAISALVKSYLNRDLLSAEYIDTFDGNDGRRIQFPNYPVTAIRSVSIDGRSIAPIEQIAQNATGFVFDRGQVMLIGYAFTRGYQNITVAYTAGFASTPLDVEEAVIETIALRYRERDRIGNVSKSIAGETVTFMIKDFSDSARTILKNYRKIAPI